jgi:hypothetical protein
LVIFIALLALGKNLHLWTDTTYAKRLESFRLEEVFHGIQPSPGSPEAGQGDVGLWPLPPGSKSGICERIGVCGDAEYLEVIINYLEDSINNHWQKITIVVNWRWSRGVLKIEKGYRATGLRCLLDGAPAAAYFFAVRGEF